MSPASGDCYWSGATRQLLALRLTQQSINRDLWIPMKKLSRSRPNKVNPHSFQIHGEFSELCIPLSTKVNVTGKLLGKVKWHNLEVSSAVMVEMCLWHALCGKILHLFEDTLSPTSVLDTLSPLATWCVKINFHILQENCTKCICSEGINYIRIVLLWWALSEKITFSIIVFLFQNRMQDRTHCTDNVDRVVVEKLQFEFHLIYNSLWASS